MWILQLNPMQGNAEQVSPVAYAETKEALILLLKRERTEPYQDGQWHKCFRRGVLEWFNDPGPNMEPWIGVQAFVDVGTEADWMRQASEEFQRLRSKLFAA